MPIVYRRSSKRKAASHLPRSSGGLKLYRAKLAAAAARAGMKVSSSKSFKSWKSSKSPFKILSKQPSRSTYPTTSRSEPSAGFAAKVNNVLKYSASEFAQLTVRQTGRIVVVADTQYLDFIRDTGTALPISQVYNGTDVQAVRAAYVGPINATESADYQIKSWVQRWTFHNNSNTQMDMVFYEFRARYTIPNVVGADAAQAFTRGMVNMVQGTGSATWTGITQGATPFMFRPFTTQYSIYRTIRKTLLPGQQYHYTFAGRRNKTIHMDRYVNATTGGLLIFGEQDCYKGFLVRVTGTPVNSLAAFTVVNTAVGGIDFTCIEDMEVGWNVFQNYKRYYLNTPAASFPATVNPVTMVEAVPTGGFGTLVV